MTSSSRLRRSYFATLATNSGLAAIGLITGALSARLLGPAGRGELAAIQNVPMLLMVLASVGVPNALAFFAAREPGAARGLFVTGLLLGLAGALPAMVLGWILLPVALSGQAEPIVAAARGYLLLIPLGIAAGFPLWVLQGMSRFRAWNLMRILPGLGWLGVLLASLAGHPGAADLARRFLATYALLIPIALLALAATTEGPWSPARRAGDLLRYGAPSVLSSVPAHLNLRLDQILMAALLPAEQLGLYAVGVAWSGAAVPVLSALGSVLLPRLASDPGADVARYVRMTALTAAITSATMLVATPLALPILFGRAFEAAAPAMPLLVLAAGLAGVNGVLEEMLRGLGAPGWPLRAQLVGLVATLALLALLLQRFAAVGAALASIGSYAAILLVLVIGIRRKSGVELGGLVPRPADLRELVLAVRAAVASRHG